MTYTKTTLVILLLCLFVAVSVAQQKSKIEGVWQLVSSNWSGKTEPAKGTHIKVITKNHWVWFDQDKDKSAALLAKKTTLDSAEAYTNGFGYGTYTLKGDTYTETIEQFTDLEYIGMSLPFKVKVEGNRLIQSGKFPVLENGKKIREIQFEEEYKRIE